MQNFFENYCAFGIFCYNLQPVNNSIGVLWKNGNICSVKYNGESILLHNILMYHPNSFAYRKIHSSFVQLCTLRGAE